MSEKQCILEDASVYRSGVDHLDDVMNLGSKTKTLTLSNTLMYLPSSQLITPPPSLKKILTEVIHHDVTNLHGLLHVIVLAILSVVAHQHT